MKMFRKNLNTNFIRICRIQTTSKERNRNIYPDHLYTIKYKFDNVYYPDSANDVVEKKLKVYAGPDKYYFANDNQFYVRTVTEDDYEYIEIGVPVPTYSTNIHVEVESVNQGSVTLYCDPANIDDYTRANYVGSELHYILDEGCHYQWTNSNVNFIVKKGIIRVTDLYTGTIASINGDDLFNADNASFTLSKGTTGSYAHTVHVVAKRNCALLVESLK